MNALQRVLFLTNRTVRGVLQIVWNTIVFNHRDVVVTQRLARKTLKHERDKIIGLTECIVLALASHSELLMLTTMVVSILFIPELIFVFTVAAVVALPLRYAIRSFKEENKIRVGWTLDLAMFVSLLLLGWYTMAGIFLYYSAILSYREVVGQMLVHSHCVHFNFKKLVEILTSLYSHEIEVGVRNNPNLEKLVAHLQFIRDDEKQRDEIRKMTQEY